MNSVPLRLDDLYKVIANTYSEQNAQRPPSATFAHFVEVCGMLTIHSREKKREGFTFTDALCKAFGWYFPLMAKFRVTSIEDLVFRKFPLVCPYCRLKPHKDMPARARAAPRELLTIKLSARPTSHTCHQDQQRSTSGNKCSDRSIRDLWMTPDPAEVRSDCSKNLANWRKR
jgi:hypothetical protein